MSKEHPTIRERVQEDGVGMRWVRTAATTVSALTAALMVIWGVLFWLVEPRAMEWAEDVVESATGSLASTVEQNTRHLEKLDLVVDRMEEAVESLAALTENDPSPSWRWSIVDTSISDGAIGGRVTITAAGVKLRDCGAPTVDLYFVNGGGNYHRFAQASILSSGGRGVALPPDPTRLQTLTYTAVIPGDDGVTPGRAQGYISVVYEDCPATEAAVVGPLQFRITD